MTTPVVQQWLNALWSYVSFIAVVVFACAAVRYWRAGHRIHALRFQLVLSLAAIALGDACVRAIVLYAYHARLYGHADGVWSFLSHFVQGAGVLCVVGTLMAIRAATFEAYKERLWLAVATSGIVAIAVHTLMEF